MITDPGHKSFLASFIIKTEMTLTMAKSTMARRLSHIIKKFSGCSNQPDLFSEIEGIVRVLGETSVDNAGEEEVYEDVDDMAHFIADTDSSSDEDEEDFVERIESVDD